MENCPLKRNADGVISPEAASHSKSAKEGESFSCTICLEDIPTLTDDCSGVDLIFCEGACDSWINRRCAGLPKIVFESIKLSEKPFFCPSCRLSEFERLIKGMQTTITSLENKIATLEKSTPPTSHNHTKVNTDTQSTGPPISPTDIIQPVNNIQEVVATYLNEEKEKQKRRLNIIIHNTPESTSEDGLTRKNHDIGFVNKLCQTQFNTEVSVTKAFRLGKKGAKP